MDPDPYGHGAVAGECTLNVDCGRNRSDRTRKDGEATVAIVLSDPTTVLRSGGSSGVTLTHPGGKRFLLVPLHHGGITHHVREHHGSELAR